MSSASAPPFSRGYIRYAIGVIFLVSVFNVIDRTVISMLMPGPNGIQNDAPEMAVTTSSGNAFFELTTRDRGTWTFRVEDVVLEGHRFDRADSVTTATIKSK